MNKIPYVVIVVLVVIIILMRSCSDVDSKEVLYTKTDTIYKEIKDTVIKKVNVVSVKYVPVKEPIFTSVDTCNKEYNKQTVYRDTISIDSIGSLTVIDTVFQNKLGKRTIFKDYNIPSVIKTVTIIKEQDPKRQLYIGGNLFGDRRTLQIITPGVIYKDRKDRVYQANVGVDFDGTLNFGVGTYWKINLKK
jgi:hypothetical protein